MNRTSIEYLNLTWNPITGCLHTPAECATWDKCWARAYARRFPEKYALGFYPRFHPERLNEPLEREKPARIGVSFMGDMWGCWVPDDWQQAVLEVVRKAPQHTFLFLTKAPENLPKWNPWPLNAWVGLSITHSSMGTPKQLSSLLSVDATVHWVSFEPLLGQVSDDIYGVDWVVIGAQTGLSAIIPKKHWVEDVEFQAARYAIPVFRKDNLCRALGLPQRKEWPKGQKE